MQIDNNGIQARMAAEALEAKKVSAPQAKEKDNASTTASGSPDTLSLTSEASQMQALESQIAELPVVDTKRVQDVQKALATGSFQVDPAKVAEKMLNFESGLS
jgi:negative regulator of flagellin synthesis FlgM